MLCIAISLEIQDFPKWMQIVQKGSRRYSLTHSVEPFSRFCLRGDMRGEQAKEP